MYNVKRNTFCEVNPYRNITTLEFPLALQSSAASFDKLFSFFSSTY